MRNRTTQDTKQNQVHKITQLFAGFASSLQADAKRFNEEHKKNQRKIREWHKTYQTSHQSLTSCMWTPTALNLIMLS